MHLGASKHLRLYKEVEGGELGMSLQAPQMGAPCYENDRSLNKLRWAAGAPGGSDDGAKEDIWQRRGG